MARQKEKEHIIVQRVRSMIELLSKELYDVVKRAVSDERNQRQQSISELIEEWEAAK